MNPLHENPHHRTLRLAAALALGLFCGGRAFALDPARDLLQYNCQSWTRQNGLPVNGIKTITQSKDGFLWLGTAVGLLRFDGANFKLIDLTRVPGIRGSIVTSVANANDGGLWVGLQDGSFGYFDGRSLSLRGKPEWGGLSLDVRSVMEAKDGTLWLATHLEAARITRAGSYEPVMTATPERPADILFHFADSHGRQWIATAAEGLYYWFDGKLVRFPDPIVVTTLGMAEDPAGNIWIAGPAGLLCYDANLRRKEVPPLAATIRTLLFDQRGILWIGTDGSGLVRYQHGAYSFLRKADGLASDYVTALMDDSEGDLWVGTSGGLSQLRDVKFAAENPTADPSAGVAAAVYPAARGGAWVAGNTGVTRFDGTTRQAYSTQAGLPAATVKRVFESRNGDLYLVSGLTTLVILSGEKVVAIHPASTLVVGMVEDAKSVIVSVGGSLYRASKDGLTPYAFAGVQPIFNWILNLAPGKDGAFWVASERGIFRVKDGTFQQWSAPEGLPESNVWTIMEDNDGAVWASTPTGIVRLKDNQIRAIGRKDGLFDDNIYAIVPDDLGNFWIDSGRGIFRVRRQAMNDFADGRIGRVESVAFDGPDSVTTADKTSSQERVGCKSRDGRIWFPSAKGIVIIDPAHIPTNRIPPAVHLDRVLANGVEVDPNTPLIVPPGRGELEFHFEALSFAAPERVKILYQLEGYDKDWVVMENRRAVFYTNLRPGHYVFRVTAANGDGVWNKTGDTLPIELRPQVYQTVWFATLCGGAFLAALAGAYLWRVRLLRQKQQALRAARDQLEIEVAHRTSELARANASLHSEIGHRQQTEAQLQLKTQTLEKEIEERKRIGLEIARVHRQLLDASRQAGMAEVATGVLHNVGNVLNSVNVSATLVADQVHHGKAGNIAKVAALLNEHQADLAGFLTTDHRGRMIPAYLATLADELANEQTSLIAEVDDLRKNVAHIKDIVAMQQAHAGSSGMIETVAVPDLVEDAMRMNASSLARHDVTLFRDYQTRPVVTIDKHKVMQILVNLVRNAKQACDESGRSDKQITVRTTGDDRSVKIAVIDNGVGIPAENLDRIFNHGFTTKQTGHGFGLHNSALAARELGGALTVRSDGPGCGATFTLELPCPPTPPAHENPVRP